MTVPAQQDELPLFPIRVAAYFDSPWKSADLRQIARTFDGHEYAVRWPEDGNGLPASEWLGYRVAQACQMATPFATVLTDEKGRLGFGSRIEHGVVQFSTLPPDKKIEVVRDCGQALSAVIGLDHFLGNEDRHLDNWLFRVNMAGKWTPLVIDFSRALFVRGFPHDEHPLPACNTRTVQAILKRSGCWDGPFAVFAVQQVLQIKAATISHWLADCPTDWLSVPERQALTQWWGSPAYHSRLESSLQQL